MGLVLSAKFLEVIKIGSDIEISVEKYRSNVVRIKIEAPSDKAIYFKDKPKSQPNRALKNVLNKTK